MSGGHIVPPLGCRLVELVHSSCICLSLASDILIHAFHLLPLGGLEVAVEVVCHVADLRSPQSPSEMLQEVLDATVERHP